jgi:hypothetical protein
MMPLPLELALFWFALGPELVPREAELFAIREPVSDRRHK